MPPLSGCRGPTAPGGGWNPLEVGLILGGSTDAPAFESSLEQVLAPRVQPGQIVVLDNLSAHADPRVGQASAAQGRQLLFSPSYSPDLSPIEEAFPRSTGAF